MQDASCSSTKQDVKSPYMEKPSCKVSTSPSPTSSQQHIQMQKHQPAHQLLLCNYGLSSYFYVDQSNRGVGLLPRVKGADLRSCQMLHQAL
ncbi:hypothetical protein ACHAW6_005561 [Cyclotella cf. meneghiniana]